MPAETLTGDVWKLVLAGLFQRGLYGTRFLAASFQQEVKKQRVKKIVIQKDKVQKKYPPPFLKSNKSEVFK